VGGSTAGVTSTITPAQILDRVLDDVLTDASKWCQGDAAQAATGERMPCDNPQAVRFCILGAIGKAISLEGHALVTEWKTFSRTVSLVESVAGGRYTPAFNDDPHTTFEDVRLLLKRAREVAE